MTSKNLSALIGTLGHPASRISSLKAANFVTRTFRDGRNLECRCAWAIITMRRLNRGMFSLPPILRGHIRTSRDIVTLTHSRRKHA